METNQPSVEELINMVLTDIQQKGYSAILPFDIGEVEQRMLEFAEVNSITLGSDGRYLVKETKRQGRIAHHHTDATVPHIVALLGSTFHAAKIKEIADFFILSSWI